MALPFASPQEETQYNDYLAQLNRGFANYGMTDPFATGAPTVSPTGSVWDWVSQGAKGIHNAIDPFKTVPGLKQGAAAVEGVLSVASFLSDVPRLLVTISGFALIIFGLMAAANMNPIQVIVPGKK